MTLAPAPLPAEAQKYTPARGAMVALLAASPLRFTTNAVLVSKKCDEDWGGGSEIALHAMMHHDIDGQRRSQLVESFTRPLEHQTRRRRGKGERTTENATSQYNLNNMSLS